MAEIALSILIPSIPERLPQLGELFNAYEWCIQKYGLTQRVEVLAFCDNKQRTIGKKRTDMIALSSGKYIVMSDEDDKLTRRYFELIMSAIDQNPDVITYNQFARINNEYTFVEFRLKNPVEHHVHMGITRRPAWHCCTWRRSLIQGIAFTDSNWGEDHEFAMKANELAQSEIHIPDICHVYEHDSHLSAAFQ